MPRNMILALALGVAAGACASTAEEPVDPNAPEVCIVLDNSQGTGTQSRIYLVSRSNERIRIGDITMGRTERHCIRRSNFEGQWQLLVERPASDRIDPARRRQTQAEPLRSETFFLNPGDVIEWNIHLNRILLGGGD